MRRIVWVVGMLVGMMAAGPAASAAEAQAGAPMKIGHVNSGRLFRDYQRTKESEASLEQKNKSKQAELEDRVNDLKKLRESLELLNDQAKEAKARELEEKTDEFRRLKAHAEQDLMRDRNQAAQGILEEIKRAVAEYAKANGYTLIVDQSSLLYAEERQDATDEILKTLNDQYASAKGSPKKSP